MARVRAVLLGLGLGASVAVAAPFPDDEARPEPRRPHILFLLLDDVGPHDLGCYGATPSITPNIDALAASGMRFDQFYSCASLCSPSRFAIQTGRHPVELGLWDVLPARTKRGIPAEFPLISEVLSAAGYATCHVGKWHLGKARPEFGAAERGYATTVRSEGTRRSAEESDGPHITQHLVDGAIEQLEQRGEAPLFLHLCFFAAHANVAPPPDWAARFPDTPAGRKSASLAHADRQIGRLIETVDRLGLAEDTLILLSSDNGPVGEEEAGPLRGGKHALFEAGIRVPTIARWSGRVPAGAVDNGRWSGLDFFPSFAALAGRAEAARDLPGSSFHSRLGPAADAEPAPAARTLYFDQRDAHAVLRDRWKLVYSRSRDATELFDLEADPGEQHDLSAEHPERVSALQAEYRRWRRSTARLPLRLEQSREPAVLDADGRLRVEEGGSAQLAFSTRHDFHDGSFSVRLVLHPSALPRRRVPLIERDGSWRLLLESSGRLILTVKEDEEGKSTHQLDSVRPIPLDQPSEVVISFRGRRQRADDAAGSGGAIRLHVDGELRSSSGYDAVRSGDAPIVVAPPRRGAGFQGTIEGLELYAIGLSEAEIASPAKDG